MNDKEIICCYNNTEDKCPAKINCLGIIATILLVSFGVVIGLIVGAQISASVLAALPAVIVLAVVLGLLFILNLILLLCNKNKCRR